MPKDLIWQHTCDSEQQEKWVLMHIFPQMCTTNDIKHPNCVNVTTNIHLPCHTAATDIFSIVYSASKHFDIVLCALTKSTVFSFRGVNDASDTVKNINQFKTNIIGLQFYDASFFPVSAALFPIKNCK